MTMVSSEAKVRGVRVFLSYSTEDRPYALRLQKLLSPYAKFRVFTTDALSAGEDWTPKLREEIVRSDVFMVLLSPTSVGSSWVLQELGAAWALNKPIIPVVTQPEVAGKLTMALQDSKPVDYRSLDDPAAVAQLLERLAEGADPDPSATSGPE